MNFVQIYYGKNSNKWQKVGKLRIVICKFRMVWSCNFPYFHCFFAIESTGWGGSSSASQEESTACKNKE